MDCSPPGSFVDGILQARILEWVAIPFSRWSFWPRGQILFSCIAGRFFTVWATREAGSLCPQGQQICWSGLMEKPNLMKTSHLILCQRNVGTSILFDYKSSLSQCIEEPFRIRHLFGVVKILNFKSWVSIHMSMGILPYLVLYFYLDYHKQDPVPHVFLYFLPGHIS